MKKDISDLKAQQAKAKSEEGEGYHDQVPCEKPNPTKISELYSQG